VIAAVDARTTAVGCLLRAPLLAGCQFDWTKPQYNPVVALGEFQTDHLACLRIAGTPPGLFRGQEDEGPVALDQTATAGPVMSSPGTRGSSTNFARR
jgi:hypothetical protein